MYQSEKRIKIKELWVPAAMIIEENLKDDAGLLRAEARHRLKEGKGIRVFSRPDRLKDWLESEGLKIEDREHLITGAGQLVPGFKKDSEGMEFFVHSPFSTQSDGGIVDRNESSLIFHILFTYKGNDTRFILIGDTTCEILTEIVNLTKLHKNKHRLMWDVFDTPHHCSYLALNSEKGKEKTEPVQEVKWLLDQGQNKGILVSCVKLGTVLDFTKPSGKKLNSKCCPHQSLPYHSFEPDKPGQKGPPCRQRLSRSKNLYRGNQSPRTLSQM